MPSIKSRIKVAVLLGVAATLVSGCMSKDVVYTDQQKRMVRCDQYIGESREECLRGLAVTIEDYKADWREFERDEKKKREEEAAKIKKTLPKITVIKPEIKT